MPKTLLLCFIHGFKGDEETFFDFPLNLKDKVASQCPQVDVQTRVYPKYETRGDLAACVETFKEWLQEQVISIEVANGNKSAILEPDVGVILIAHSMGGFVVADTLFSVLDNRPVSADPNKKLMFPLIHGVLLFDTPFNGLAGSMFAYGAFTQYQNISGIYNILSTVTSSLAIGGPSVSSAGATTAAAGASGAALASQAGSWRRWQALASRTGAYGAIMAGGVAAYVHRQQIYNSLSSLSMPTRESLSKVNYKDNISQGLTFVSRDAIGEGFAWMASHLKFVGALMKTGQLTQRLERLESLEGVGVTNFYTSLGQNDVWNGGYFVPKRTFCAVPGGKEKEIESQDPGMWKEISNPKAGNEIEAHCSMFRKEKNDGYDAMLDVAKGLVCQWLSNEPKAVVDDYKPSREVLHRSISETKLWDDDGRVLNPEMQSKKEGTEDEEQLQAILKCDDMPLPEGGDEASFMEALEVPLPVDKDLADATKVLSLKDAIKVPLPEDEEVDFGRREEINKEKQENFNDRMEKSSGWSFKSPLLMIYGSQKGMKQEEPESQEEKPKSAGWSVKNPLSMLYGSQREIQTEVQGLESI